MLSSESYASTEMIVMPKNENNDAMILTAIRRSLKRKGPPLRTMSETSMYRMNSQESDEVKKSVKQTSKVLDWMMECFWLCSLGCKQT